MTGPITRGTIRTTFVLGLRLAVQAGTLLLVARMLGPDEFGAFAGVAALAVMLGTLSTFGTHLVLLGEVSKDPARRAQVLPWAIPSTLLCGAVLLAMYLALCATLLPHSGVSLVTLIAIGTTEALLQPLFTLPAMEHLALGRIARSQLLQTLPLALRLIAAVIVFLLAPAEPLTVYGYGYLAASVVALGFAFVTLPSAWPPPARWRLPGVKELKEAGGYAALAITATSPAELDKALATRLLPLADAGLYAAGARVVGAATLPVIALMLSALPRMFREGDGQPKRTDRLLRWIFVVTFIYSIVLAIALWLLAPLFVLVFGPKFEGIQRAIHWLTLAVPGMALRMAAGNALMALGKPWMRVGFEALGLAVLGITAAILAPRFAIAGMPLALACSEWTMVILGSALIYHVRRRRATINSPAA